MGASVTARCPLGAFEEGDEVIDLRVPAELRLDVGDGLAQPHLAAEHDLVRRLTRAWACSSNRAR